MEFVNDGEVLHLLKEYGIAPQSGDDERVYLDMDSGGEVVRIHLATEDASVEPADGARVISTTIERLPEMIESIIHRLRLNQVLLVPVGKWRSVFDAVAFSLAENEDWQEIDTTATVELNTRDPLLCEPGDYHTVHALMRALLSDAEEPEQGIMLTTTAAPLLLEVVPDGAVRVAFGNQVLADEAAEAVEALA